MFEKAPMMLLAVGQVGQQITRNTGVSIALVIVIVLCTAWITDAVTSTKNDIANLQTDVEDIKSKQQQIFEYVQGNPLPQSPFK